MQVTLNLSDSSSRLFLSKQKAIEAKRNLLEALNENDSAFFQNALREIESGIKQIDCLIHSAVNAAITKIGE